MHLHAKRNEYAAILGEHLDRIPKAVFAAIALSFANQVATDDIDDFDCAIKKLFEEWDILHQNGIVPQKPYRQSKAKAEAR